MNKNYANQAVGTYYDNKYYLAIPTGDSTKNNTLIVFDVVNNSFYRIFLFQLNPLLIPFVLFH